MSQKLFKNVAKILDLLVVRYDNVATRIVKFETDFLYSTNAGSLIPWESYPLVTVASNGNSPMPSYIHYNMHHET